MRGFLLAALLTCAATPSAVLAKEGEGKCFWSQVPAAEREKAIRAYGADGSSGFVDSLKSDFLAKLTAEQRSAYGDACGRNLSEAESEAYAAALLGYGLEETALNSMADWTGSPRSFIAALWETSAKKQRQNSETQTVDEGYDVTDGMREALAAAGLDEGETEFDLLALVVGWQLREAGEAAR